MKRQVGVRRWTEQAGAGGDERGLVARRFGGREGGRAGQGLRGMPRSNSAEEIVSFVWTGKHLGEAGQ